VGHERSRGARSILLAAVASSVLLAFGVATAIAAEGYEFEPLRSLSGNCKVSKGDPVPDPPAASPEQAKAIEECEAGSHPPHAFGATSESNTGAVRSITTDFYGDIYVASSTPAEEKAGRVDIFNPEGLFITEVAEPVGPRSIAVDSLGNLYVSTRNHKVQRFSPTAPYEPLLGKIKYESPPVLVFEDETVSLDAIAINPVNNRPFLNMGHSIFEFGSAAEGNPLKDKTIGEGVLANFNGQGLAIDAANNRLYASDSKKVRVFELASPHKLLLTVEGSSMPDGNLTFNISLAANEKSGHFFIFDEANPEPIEEFEFVSGEPNEAKHLATIEHKIKGIFGAEIGADNGQFSPNRGYLFAPTEEGPGRSFAFSPPQEKFAPVVESASVAEVTDSGAELRATVNPKGLETEYVFEYTTQEDFEANEFATAVVAGEGKIPAGTTGVKVTASASGLSPETEYRFRVRASNEKGDDDEEATFTTYPSPETILPCPNDATRTGLSALLPDCRAYELVSPPDTDARTPLGVGTLGVYFGTRESSPAGDKVSFFVEGGALPGTEGTGFLAGDPYLSTRGANGWSTTSAGPTGAESPAPLTGSTSPDQGYSFWESNGEGSAAFEGRPTSYVRYPDGHSAFVGRGSLQNDPQAAGRLISENGSHIIFTSNDEPGDSAIQLEQNAPLDGTNTVYDRTADEVTHVVSLLPNEETPAAGEDAAYKGASLDGKGVAFVIGGELYLRFDNQKTYEIGAGLNFAGIAEGGHRIFYLEGGDLFAFDAEGEETIRFTETGDVTPVNVSADGTAAYFVSPTALPTEPNPQGATPVEAAGLQNLYLSEGVGSSIDFVGVVTDRDVKGEFIETERVEGLGLWTNAVTVGEGGNAGRYGVDPSRSTPNGSALLFESRADLTGYDPEGHSEVYRYDSAGELQCLSCNPTGAAATSDASLESLLLALAKSQPLGKFAIVNNLRADGHRAFFQSSEPLVLSDTDGLQDIYEWEAQGTGSCGRPEGCIYLVSSGESDRVDYLYAVSDSGDDVFFRSADQLLPSDTESTPSIYDARVGGGFREEPEVICQGEGCRPTITPPPTLPTPGIQPSDESGNAPPEPPAKHCPKGKHKVKRGGKVVCVKKHQKHKKHNRAGTKRKGASK
jgi:hypothetical protein